MTECPVVELMCGDGFTRTKVGETERGCPKYECRSVRIVPDCDEGFVPTVVGAAYQGGNTYKCVPIDDVCPLYMPLRCKENEERVIIADERGCPKSFCRPKACPVYQKPVCVGRDVIMVEDKEHPGCKKPICRPIPHCPREKKCPDGSTVGRKGQKEIDKAHEISRKLGKEAEKKARESVAASKKKNEIQEQEKIARAKAEKAGKAAGDAETAMGEAGKIFEKAKQAEREAAKRLEKTEEKLQQATSNLSEKQAQEKEAAKAEYKAYIAAREAWWRAWHRWWDIKAWRESWATWREWRHAKYEHRLAAKAVEDAREKVTAAEQSVKKSKEAYDTRHKAMEDAKKAYERATKKYRDAQAAYEEARLEAEKMADMLDKAIKYSHEKSEEYKIAKKKSEQAAAYYIKLLSAPCEYEQCPIDCSIIKVNCRINPDNPCCGNHCPQYNRPECKYGRIVMVEDDAHPGCKKPVCRRPDCSIIKVNCRINPDNPCCGNHCPQYNRPECKYGRIVMVEDDAHPGCKKPVCRRSQCPIIKRCWNGTVIRGRMPDCRRPERACPMIPPRPLPLPPMPGYGEQPPYKYDKKNPCGQQPKICPDGTAVFQVWPDCKYPSCPK